MLKRLATFQLLATVALAACTAGEDPSDEASGEAQPPADYAAGSANDDSPVPPMVSPVGRIDDAEPDLAPPRLSPEAERSEAGARNLLLAWARAIELKEFGQAWAMMGDAGGAEWSKAGFAEVFDGLGTITVAVPEGEMEGAAGSSYYTTRATITATGADGRPVRIEGPMVLRRVNDVPGASPEQLRWHFERVELDWTH